jgi:sulfate transport system ATP-binding protein
MSVEIAGVGKRFGAGAVLSGIDLTVANGEFLALLGPSGSGKTTLLRIVAGLEMADEGSVRLDGLDMANVRANQRQVGFVFQNYALFRHMSVADNIAFGLEVRPRQTRPKQAEIRRRVAELLEMIQLPELGRRFPSQLSGGQRQRVALARALAIEPRVLLLDEPFGALDAQVRKDLRRWLRSLHDRLGLTTIFVTHDQREALDLADRVAVMRAGRIEQVDSPKVLYAHPATPAVFDFLGDAIRLDCVVRDGAAHFTLPLPPLPTDAAPGPAVAMIRPYQVAITASAEAQIVAVHEAGVSKQVEVAVGGCVFELVMPSIAHVPGPGEPCGLDFGMARIFPAPGGCP